MLFTRDTCKNERLKVKGRAKRHREANVNEQKSRSGMLTSKRNLKIKEPRRIKSQRTVINVKFIKMIQ